MNAIYNIQITDEQHNSLNEDGYFIVENALPLDLVERLEERVDSIYQDHLDAGYDPHTRNQLTAHKKLFLSKLPRQRSDFCKYLGLV